jgi:hypothetical protein
MENREASVRIARLEQWRDFEAPTLLPIFLYIRGSILSFWFFNRTTGSSCHLLRELPSRQQDFDCGCKRGEVGIYGLRIGYGDNDGHFSACLILE